MSEGRIEEILRNEGWRRLKDIWHKYPKEKPTKDGFYMVAQIVGDYPCSRRAWIDTVKFYTKSGKFNYLEGEEDTEIKPDFWAEIADVFPQL